MAVTERARASGPETSQDVDAFARTLLAHAPLAALELDPSGRVRDCNARAEALLNRPVEALRLLGFADLLRPDDRDRFAAAVQACAGAGEAPPEFEVSLAALEGESPLVAVTLLPVHDGTPRVLMLLRDLTGARQSRKMEDLGRLVAGVAHELRTPISYALTSLHAQRAKLDHLLSGEPHTPEDLESLARDNALAVDGLDRAARLLLGLRPLSKNRPRNVVPMDLAELVVEAVRTFRGTFGGSVRVELDLRSTHLVPLDREDMVMVLQNLLVNAAQATGGREPIRVMTRNETVPPEIRVIDHGPGVPPAARARLFEPFHTTKADGTGLGLFISRRAVEAHGGQLTYEDTPGGGATFVVRLPPVAPT
jgi:signal transduction histidine kinase